MASQRHALMRYRQSGRRHSAHTNRTFAAPPSASDVKETCQNSMNLVAWRRGCAHMG